MPILSTDIQTRLSGGAANANVNASLGGAKSSVAVVNNTLHNLFDVVAAAESAAGDTEYRCIYIHNAHATLTFLSPKLWIQSNTPSADTDAAIAVAAAGLNGTAELLGNESTAPTGGEVFTAPSSEGTAIALPDIPAGQHIGIYIRRTVNVGSAAYNNDGMTLRVKGETGA